MRRLSTKSVTCLVVSLIFIRIRKFSPIYMKPKSELKFNDRIHLKWASAVRDLTQSPFHNSKKDCQTRFLSCLKQPKPISQVSLLPLLKKQRKNKLLPQRRDYMNEASVQKLGNLKKKVTGDPNHPKQRKTRTKQ